LEAPDADLRLAAQAAFPQVRGIRQILNWHPDPSRTYTPADLSRDPRWQAGFGLLARHGLSFDLQCYPGQMPGMATLIGAHRDVPVIINHCGMPVLSDSDGLDEWRRGLRALASMPHVSIKLSGFGFIRRDWTTETVLPLVREVIDLFSTDRCMLASDTPTDKLFAPLTATRDLFEALLEDFSDAERRALCGRNANRIYRLGLEL
jgi:predicted TIM-barrel fold metal-dependent hydrolase